MWEVVRPSFKELTFLLVILDEVFNLRFIIAHLIKDLIFKN